ncbi:CG1532 [Drosophila busckii]|uniref:CG1532 n=1 Tax=Drosophila busckii TaxID=30019 RepID=A0A0M4F9S9_DROBS|nr:glyoxalase domain-containing protein 4 [Drosophila busckii]ALC49362.1 CG1532 [Drosophila busckii]
MANVTGRALHYVFKIGDRAKNIFFFRTILGMQVLRHEEFKEGCEAQCNGPYDNRWSKTMMGYGPESAHFVVELTYNYGVKSYELGNDFGGLTIHSNEILKRAAEHSYPTQKQDERSVLTSPDGYKVYVVNSKPAAGTDPVKQVELHVSDLAASRKYWHELLKMKLLEQTEQSVLLSYGNNQAALRLLKLQGKVDRAQAYGRIAFAVPAAEQPQIQAAVEASKGVILKPLIKLDTPGKASVTVVILADPDGHEICFVDEEGFGELSQFEAEGEAQLDKFIRKDPFQDK